MDLMRFLPVAKAIAGLSKDPACKVAALIIDDDANLISTGFNGFPRGVIDHDYRLQNRNLKLCMIVHAEANAIVQAARTGAKTYGANMIVTERYPCSTCAGLIIQAGIKRVYAPIMRVEETNQQWIDDKEYSEKMFRESGVEIIEYGDNQA